MLDVPGSLESQRLPSAVAVAMPTTTAEMADGSVE
jgi:hypothetical protein